MFDDYRLAAALLDAEATLPATLRVAVAYPLGVLDEDRISLAMALDQQFQEAADAMSNKVNKTLSDDELKEVYALYKQATVGDVNIDRPGMLDFKGKAKWDSWNSKKGMDKEKAKQEYIDFVNKMAEKHGRQ